MRCRVCLVFDLTYCFNNYENTRPTYKGFGHIYCEHYRPDEASSSDDNGSKHNICLLQLHLRKTKSLSKRKIRDFNPRPLLPPERKGTCCRIGEQKAYHIGQGEPADYFLSKRKGTAYRNASEAEASYLEFWERATSRNWASLASSLT